MPFTLISQSELSVHFFTHFVFTSITQKSMYIVILTSCTFYQHDFQVYIFSTIVLKVRYLPAADTMPKYVQTNHVGHSSHMTYHVTIPRQPF